MALVALVLIKAYTYFSLSKAYPYGRGKFETVGTFLVACTLVGSGVGIGWHSAEKAFLDTSHELPGNLALYGALLSIGIKEFLYQVINSNLFQQTNILFSSD